ncbi:MAG TPA: hypothetical protein VGQ17_11075 [Gemmatimonadales bacterium]|jgi:hypothetical protein|nr:hypothetical protein [Gemmatimonadales bacterium]
MPPKKPTRVRQQVMVYLDARDRALLEEVAEKTGLARTEIFRRGLRKFAGGALGEKKPGSAIDLLIATATPDGFPPDVAERHDYYLYGGGYEKRLTKRKRRTRRARPR